MLETIVGGWTIEAKPCELPPKLKDGFSQAFEGFVGATYEPLLYVGSQLVNGTNYMFICKGSYVTGSSYEFVAKVVLNEALPAYGGKFTIVSIKEI